ncbi:MAG: hypothetical protein E7231_05420 [Cellulosilyticum sp.]|nr:hypothetical protein [Cellulosilyticum sp.]
MKHIKQYPFLFSIILSVIIGEGLVICGSIRDLTNPHAHLIFSDIMTLLFLGILCAILIVYPFILTLFNTLFLFKTSKDIIFFKCATLVLGSLYSSLYLSISNISFTSNWNQALLDTELHTPIFTESIPTLIIILCISLLGYLLLTLIPLGKLSPLLIVCSISALYLGIIECTLWIIQTWGDVYLILFPFNCILLATQLIIKKIQEWNHISTPSRSYSHPLLNRCNHFLMKSSRWPVAAFFLMWPLSGIIICILVLFGQEPDAAIKAWTETSDWNLSNRTSPSPLQPLNSDGHYLCTVAAGGHRQLVKPIRLGKRHGHEIIVNRQLCIANAFEQILEEKTPTLHHHIRSFYDTYGFPIARLIRSPYIADLIYILMKPLEWFFLFILYFCDTNPENRIAIQYLPKEHSLDFTQYTTQNHKVSRKV